MKLPIMAKAFFCFILLRSALKYGVNDSTSSAPEPVEGSGGIAVCQEIPISSRRDESLIE